MHKMKRLAVAALGLAAVLGSAAPPSAAASVDDNFHVTSVYGFKQVFPGQGDSELISRVTITVPEGVNEVDYDYQAMSGGALVHDGRIVIDVDQTLGPSGQPTAQSLSLVADDGREWNTTIEVPPMSRTTVLTVKTAPKLTGVVGRTVRLAGTLMADNEPLTGHWVQIGDQRINDCNDSGFCDSAYFGLAQAQVDAAGEWSARVPVQWTSNLVATYCRLAWTCWDNNNSPSFDEGPKLVARWSAKVKMLRDPVAGRKTPVRLTVPGGYEGQVAKVQLLKSSGKWRTIAADKLGAKSRTTVKVSLSAGRQRIRALVPRTTRYFGEHSEPWAASRVNKGTSKTYVVKVGR